jgi:hypothetical protein
MALTDTITPQWLKDRYLVGIDLTDDTGAAYPDVLFTHAISAAISTVESELDIVLEDLSTYTDRLDVLDWAGDTFWLLQTKQRPLREIVEVQVQYGQYGPTTIPNDWANIASERGGQLQIIPGPSGMTSVIFTGGTPFVGLIGFYGRPYTPLWWKIKYKAGFDGIKGVPGVEYPVPPSILDMVGLMASLLPLDTAGDLIVGAGIASKSISMDGLSTNINTTSSATNSGYGARALSYQKRLKVLIANVKRDWRLPQMLIM